MGRPSVRLHVYLCGKGVCLLCMCEGGGGE